MNAANPKDESTVPAEVPESRKVDKLDSSGTYVSELSQEEKPVHPDDFDKLQKRIERNDSISVMKWETDNGREKLPFPVRMLDGDRTDFLSSFNTHLKLQSLNRANIAPVIASELFLMPEKHGPERKSPFNYCRLGLSILLCLVIISVEIVYLFIGISNLHQCRLVDIYLITSTIFHIMIVIIEWIRQWIGNLKHHKESRVFIHVFQFSSFLLLVCLYFFSIIWYTIGFSWTMVPYTESMSNQDRAETVIVYHQNATYSFALRYCSQSFYISTIVYQIYVFCIFVFRLVMVGFSASCRALCTKLSTHSSDNNMTIPFLSVSDLNKYLPSIAAYRSVGYRNRRFFPSTVHGNASCMIMSHPEWREN